MSPNKTCIITGLGTFSEGLTVDEELQAISSCKGRGNQLSSRMGLLIGYLIRSFSPKHVQMNGAKWSKGLKCYVCVCGVGGGGGDNNLGRGFECEGEAWEAK